MARLERSLARTAHRACRCRRPRSASCCARPCAATACATASSICRSRAAWRGATMPFRRPARAPSVVVTARNLDLARLEKLAADGIAVITVPDNRWAARRHQVGVAAAQRAGQAGGARAGRPRGLVRRRATAASPKAPRRNAWIVTRDGKVVTRPADHGILRGITRTVVLDVHRGAGARASRSAPSRSRRPMRRARPSSPRRARSCMPVVQIDGRPVGNGAPGLVATALRRDFHRHAEIT